VDRDVEGEEESVESDRFFEGVRTEGEEAEEGVVGLLRGCKDPTTVRFLGVDMIDEEERV